MSGEGTVLANTALQQTKAYWECVILQQGASGPTAAAAAAAGGDDGLDVFDAPLDEVDGLIGAAAAPGLGGGASYAWAVGVAQRRTKLNEPLGADRLAWAFRSDGTVVHNGAVEAPAATGIEWQVGDIIGLCFDQVLMRVLWAALDWVPSRPLVVCAVP